jgi:hypothetical protein
MVGPRRLELQGAVRASSVAVARVLGQYGTQVPLAEDQYAVGDLDPYGTDESLRVCIRSRSPGWDLDRGDAGVGEDAVERGAELCGAVPDQEPELGWPS